MSKWRAKQKHHSGIVKNLFISYQLIFTLPLLLFVLINFYSLSEQAIERAHDTYNKTLEQTASYISYKATSIRNVIDIISYDATIQSVITQSEVYYRNNSGNWIIHTADVKNIIFNTYSTQDVVQVRLYMNEGPAAIEETREFQLMSTAEKTNWFQRLNEPSASTWQWFPSVFFSNQYDEDHISYIKKIPSLNTVNRFVGIIKADVKQSVFLDILEQSAITPNSSLLLFNDYNETITSLGKCSDGKALMETLMAQGVQMNSDVGDITLDGEKYIAGLWSINDTDWTLVMLISYNDMLASEVRARNQMIAIVLALAVIAIPISYGMSRRFTRRIRLLAENMRQFAEGEEQIPRFEEEGGDEVSILGEMFNHMIDATQELMDRQYEQGKALQALELRVLQAQINPHFLYNTLDMIRWMALRRNVPEIATTVEHMATFYKLSLGHGEETVTLSQEIQHVSNYFHLQNMRFENKLNLIVDVPEALLSCLIIKIVLQPLVENSILHGILEKENPQGTIWISATSQNDVLIVTVRDDGVGMSPEQTKGVLRKSASKDGYGVKNIQKRLSIHYGEMYGLTYESEQGKGTTVFIRIPIVTMRSSGLLLDES